jgi:hypothetical protein
LVQAGWTLSSSEARQHLVVINRLITAIVRLNDNATL